MGIIKYAAAVGLGYALARPEGRRQLLKLRDQGVRLLRRPEVARLQDRGQELVAQQTAAAASAVKEKLGRSDDRSETSTRAADVFPDETPDAAAAAEAAADATAAGASGAGAPGAGASGAATSEAAAAAGDDLTASGPRHAADEETRFGGTTVEEDSRAALSGIPPLPRPGTTPPASSPRPTPTSDPSNQ